MQKPVNTESKNREGKKSFTWLSLVKILAAYYTVVHILINTVNRLITYPDTHRTRGPVKGAFQLKQLPPT